MAEKDDEIDKILKELKGAMKNHDAKGDDSAEQSTEPADTDNAEPGSDAYGAEPADGYNAEPVAEQAAEPAQEIVSNDTQVGVKTKDDTDITELKEEETGAAPSAAEPDEILSEEEEPQYKSINDYADEYEEEEVDYVRNPRKKKAIIIAVIAFVVIVAAAAGIYFGMFSAEEEETTVTETEPTTTTTTQAPVVITNPLTGESGYNESAVGKRPIAVVVENASGARPQYNMDSPDIIVEGEVEGGITRMLWLYADMTDLPDIVGPVRSARPSFVEFSQLFDSIFVHYGTSHSSGSYTGADDYIEDNDVDNVNGMTTSACFTRTSDKVSPHNAVLVGSELLSVIEDYDYRTDIDYDSFTQFSFYDTETAVSDTDCSSITVRFSSRTDSHTFTYNETDSVYQNQNDFEQVVSFTNIIVLYTSTTYVSKSNYNGTGSTVTYCNFDLTGGTGMLASAGTVVEFNWSVEDGTLTFTAEDGSELNLNTGRSYIAIVSSNNGGSATVQ